MQRMEARRLAQSQFGSPWRLAPTADGGRSPMRIEPRLRREIPTGLAQSCLDFTGREVKVRLAAGWGWHHYIDGVQQAFGAEHTCDSGEVAVSVRSFFQLDDRLRGF